MEKQKYTAIKLNGLDHWIWFDNDDVSEDGVMFKGSSGWGKGGDVWW